MKKLIQKLTIMLVLMPASLSIGLLSSSTNAILEEYAIYPPSLVTMMISIPTLSLLIGLILSPILMRHIPAKSLVLTGLLMYGVFNALPAVVTGFYSTFLCRFIGGIGCGLIMPLQPTYAATYPEKERAALMGQSAASSCLVAAVLIAVSGFLVPGGWRRVFCLYLVVLIPFFMAIAVLPKDPYALQIKHSEHNGKQEETHAAVTDNNSAETNKDSALNVIIASYLIMVGVVLVCTGMMGVEIGQYLKQTGLGQESSSGLVMSMNFVGALLGGLMMSTYTEKTGKMGIPIVFFFCSVGCLSICFAPSIPFVFAGVLMIGLFASMMSVLVLFELSKILPLKIYTVISALCNMVVFVIQFLSPLVFLAVLGTMGGSFRAVFGLYGVILGIMIVISFILTHKKMSA